MPEQQNREYKQSWHDDYLKRSSWRPFKNLHIRHNWVCGFANEQGGYIDAWGRGTIKIIDTCKQANLPEPEMIELDGGFSITLFKDTISSEKLSKIGLNDRQVKAVLLVKQNGRITNKEYQETFGVARMTATRDLTELVDKGILNSSKTKGAGSYYEL